MATNHYHETDIMKIFQDDGYEKIYKGKEYENFPVNYFDKIKELGGSAPWVIRMVHNERFCCAFICQDPGEKGRLHYHPDADECWVILQGEYEWYIEGEGIIHVKEKDVVLARKGVVHQIKCVGDKPGIRFAITAPDTDHGYPEGEKKLVQNK